MRDNLWKMRQELKGVIRKLSAQKPLKLYTPQSPRDLFVVDIAAINSIGFYFNIYQKDNKVFITSLYKINYIINKREKKANGRN